MTNPAADAHIKDGLAAWRVGNPGAAAAAFRQALEVYPGYFDALAKLGALALSLGRLDSARDLLMAASAAAQADGENAVEALVNLAHVESALNCPQKAEDALRKALALHPGDDRAALPLAGLLRDAGHPASALAVLSALPADSRSPTIRRLTAALHLDLGDDTQAEADLQALTESVPDDAEGWFDLAETRRRRGRLGLAEAAVQKGLARHPRHPPALNTLGNILGESGRPEEAADAFRRALQAEPGYARAQSNLLLALHAVPGTTPAQNLADHQAWGLRHADPLMARVGALPAQPHPDRPLRVAMISADFRQHPVGFFLHGMVPHLDPDRLAITLYQTDPRRDWMTESLAAAPAVCLEAVAALDDDALASRIRAASPDIAIDLSGHTGANRLLVLARRVAPVQATWAAYVGTTGCQAIDVLIADRFHVPADCDADHLERVERLPDAYTCYALPPYAPAPATEPPLVHGTGPVFGCFNNPTKFSEVTIDLWAAALTAVPDARLLLVYRGLDDPAVADGLRQRLMARGVRPSRIATRGALPHQQMLAAYAEIDVALDSAPYAGGLTTLEALSMGVPVVTLEGSLFSGRHSTAYLNVLGHPEWIAQSTDAYAAIAAGLVADLPGLVALRRSLPDAVKTSPLGDGRRFAQNFTALMERLGDRTAEPPEDG